MSSPKLFIKYFMNKQPASGPVKQTDFAMHLEPVSLGAYKKALSAYEFACKTSATIRYQNKNYDIFQLDIPGKSPTGRLLIFAGVHGNEFAASLSVLDILDDIKRNPAHYESLHVRIITPLNPVGLVHQSRYNETGNDINRDFKQFATVGGQLQKEAIAHYKPNILITLHEGPQEGFFVLAEETVPKGWRSAIVRALKAEDVELADKSFFGLPIGKGYWRKWHFLYALQKLLGIYTLGRYARERNIITLTTESPWAARNVAARKRPHAIVVKTVATVFGSGGNPAILT
jgi:hypothetical protein